MHGGLAPGGEGRVNLADWDFPESVERQRAGADEAIDRGSADTQHLGGVGFRDLDRSRVRLDVEPHGGGGDGDGFAGGHV